MIAQSRIESLQVIATDDLIRNENTITIDRKLPCFFVFHDSKEFSYPHFGVHRSQEDRLVFLGCKQQVITGRFLDCRSNSPTYGQFDELKFIPSEGQMLVIPTGVGHAFDGLAGVCTLNLYRLYLPPPDELLSSAFDETLRSDVINLPLPENGGVAERIQQFTYPAGSSYYELLSQYHKQAVPRLQHEFPVTQTYTDSFGNVRRAALKRKLNDKTVWQPLPFEGGEWERSLIIWTSRNSGTVLLPEAQAFTVVPLEEEFAEILPSGGFDDSTRFRIWFVGGDLCELTSTCSLEKYSLPTLPTYSLIWPKSERLFARSESAQKSFAIVQWI